MKKRKMKIKYIVFLILLLFSLGPLYLFGWFMLYTSNMKTDEIVRENLAAVSGAQIMSLNNFCDNRRESLEMIAKYQLIQDAVKSSLEDGEADQETHGYLDNMLSERRQYVEYIVSLSVIDRNYKVVASSEDHVRFEESALKDTDIENMSADFAIGNVYEREVGGENLRMVAAHLGIYSGDELIGYIIEEIRADYFDQFRSDTNLWNSGTFYLIDGCDTTITAGSAGEESRSEYVTTEEEREDYRKAWNAIDLEKNPSGEFTYRIGGQDYITYYSGVDYTNWNVRVTVNLSEQKSNIIDSYKMLTVFSLLIVTGVLIIVNRMISSRLMRPINSMVASLKQIEEKQDYSIRIETASGDELAVLGDGVNGLLEYIEKESLQEKQYQRVLAKKAERDPLTGIRNKEAITEKIQDMIQEAAESGSPVAVGFLDIDDFKDYNTSYGHMEGDEVIRFVASVIHKELPGVVGRAGGDEFEFCVSGKVTREELEKNLECIVKRLNSNYYNRTAGAAQAIPCSIGVVLCSGEKMDYSSLIRIADDAMYQAKEKGKNGYVIVEEKMNGSGEK